MLLSDVEINHALKTGAIKIAPWFNSIQPASVDVHLAPVFRVFDNNRYAQVDPAVEQPGLTRRVDAGGRGFVLHPGRLVLGATLERIALDGTIAARLEGKSSLGRLGLLTHATAGFIDPGFQGTITLELCNISTLPIKLYPGMRIGQICFMRLSSPCAAPYGAGAEGSRYQGQGEPTESRSWQGFTLAPVEELTV